MNTASNFGGSLYAYNTRSTLTLINVAFLTNTASNGGGGLYVYGTVSETILSNATFINNTTAGYGGGAVIGSLATLSGCLFERNSGGNGGGMYAPYAVVLTDVTFISNTAAVYGGGAFFLGVTTVSGGRFERNNANDSGGGLYMWNTSTLTGTQFLSNTAGRQGGGMAVGTASTPATLTNVIFIGNIATTNRGGGAYLSGQSIINGGLFALNSAPDMTNGSGGGLYVNNTLNLTDTQFLTNTAGAQGGGLRASRAISTTLPFIGNVAVTNAGGALIRDSLCEAADLNAMWRTTVGLGVGRPTVCIKYAVPIQHGGLSRRGLYASFTPVGLVNVTFVSNTATNGQGRR
jgi:predicted outer membrane repeat protein